MRGKFLFRNKFAPIFCKSNVIRNKEELQRNNDRKYFSLYRLNRILFNWKKTLNIVISCRVDTVVHTRSSSAVTLGTINTWMGDPPLRKTRTFVRRNLYYSELPISAKISPYFQLKLCFQLIKVYI